MKPTAKAGILRVIIPIMALLVINQTFTALSFILGIRNISIFNIHKIGGLIFLALLFIHIPLNWNWITANYFKHRNQSGNQ